MEAPTQPRPDGGPSFDQDVEPRNRHSGGVAAGIVLICVGVLLLVDSIVGVDLWSFAWPFTVIIPGLALFVPVILGDKGSSSLAIPATIITTTGLILLYQNTFNQWQTWAYAWALIAPTSVGLGTWIHGRVSGQEETQRTGRRMMQVGAVIFLLLVAFFEVLINLSGWRGGVIGDVGFAILLLIVGFFLLTQSDHRTTHR